MENIFQNIKIGTYKEEELDLNISAFEMFKRLYPFGSGVFLLESLGEEGKYNRFSYVGFDPELVITATSGDLIVNNRIYKSVDPFLQLSSFSRFKSKGKDFCGGLVGYFSYESTAYFEPGFEGYKSNDFPDFQFGLYLDGFKFDKKGKKCSYFYYGKSRLGKIMKIFHKSSGNLGKFSYKTVKAPEKEKYFQKITKVLEEIKKGNIFQ